MTLAAALLLMAAPAPYRALGTEPFWALTIAGRTLRLEEPGRTPRRVRGRRVAGGGYAGRGVRVTIRRGPCSDGMSDRTYRDQVTLRWRGRVLRGCGGGWTGGE